MSQPYADAQSNRDVAPAGAVRGTNVMAILSLVFAFVFSPLGIVFGHISKRQIRRTGEGGGGLATAGLILGYIFTILAIAYVALIIWAIANSDATTALGL
jgi:hypothetical protein